jgi:hypothetical protein
MAGLVPAIHVFPWFPQQGRGWAAHDGRCGRRAKYVDIFATWYYILPLGITFGRAK